MIPQGLRLLNGFSAQTRSVQCGAMLTVWRKLMESISVPFVTLSLAKELSEYAIFPYKLL